MKKTILFLAFLTILLAGCGVLTPQEQYEAQMYATLYARDGVIPPPKYQTLAAEHYGLVLPQPTSTPNMNWTPTMNNFEYMGTQAAAVQNNAMTSEAQQQQFELEKLQAEQAAEQARLVAEQRAEEARLAAQVHADSMTAQARAAYMQGTANAEGTFIAATQQAQATFAQATSYAGATSAVQTAMIAPTSDLLTLQAARSIQTIEAGEAEKVALAVKAQTATNYIKAFFPLFIIGALAYVAGRGFQTWVKTRTHPRDEHGRPQTMTRELTDGGVVIVKPEQLESGVMKINKDGDVIRYAPMDKQEQSDITRRAQAIDAIAALPTPFAQQGPKMLSAEFGRQTPRVNFRDDQSLSPVLDEADNQLLEGSDE